jgi:hypothetical protein
VEPGARGESLSVSQFTRIARHARAVRAGAGS